MYKQTPKDIEREFKAIRTQMIARKIKALQAMRENAKFTPAQIKAGATKFFQDWLGEKLGVLDLPTAVSKYPPAVLQKAYEICLPYYEVELC